jgi:hypothetical protein
MTREAGAGLVHLAAREPLPLEVPAGSSVAATVTASCPDRHDRAGMAVLLVSPDGQTAAHTLEALPDGGGNGCEIALKAPPRVGEHLFRLILPAHDIAGVRYSEALLELPMRVMPQSSSLAVWDVPISAVAGTEFSVKAGAKSAANEVLAGRAIEVCDCNGAIAGRGVLGDAPLDGTGALYWTVVRLPAPPTEGPAEWTVRFEASDLELPHDGAEASFRVAVVPPPEHVLSVKVVEQATAAPVPEVEVRLGAYRGITGSSGCAEIALPKGQYELHVWKVGFEAPSRPVKIDADISVEIEALAVPDEDPDARWRM